MVGIRLAEAFQKLLETAAVQARQIKAKALARCGIYRGVELDVCCQDYAHNSLIRP
jgi:PIN domain nuclease of toxin-antitoxin system